MSVYRVANGESSSSLERIYLYPGDNTVRAFGNLTEASVYPEWRWYG